MSNHSKGCCSSGSGCCQSQQEKKKLVIDFLYLDLSVCERCQGAEDNLNKAIDEVSGILESAGFDIEVNKVNIDSKELAIRYQFLSSPTIRINGIDIDLNISESSCKECGDLCGDEVDCRVWVYEGIEYSEPPKSMIVNAILKSVYGNRTSNNGKIENYVLPNNLQVFFDGVSKVKR